MRAIIIEDDPLQALEYEMILDKINVNKIANYSNVTDAVKGIQLNLPDFILLDIHLDNQENGLDIIKLIEYLHIPFIIITGYPKEQFLLRAKNLKAEAFMVKPVNALSLQFEIEKLIKRIDEINASEEFIYIKEKKILFKVPYNKIYQINTEGNYSTISTSERKYVLKKSLSKILTSLQANHFLQVHRSTVINLKHVKKVDFIAQEMLLNNGEKLKIGNSYYPDIKKHIIQSSIV